MQFTKIVAGAVWGVKTDREKVYVLGDMSALVPPVQESLLVRTYLLNEPRMLLGVSSTLNIDAIREINAGGKYGYGQGNSRTGESQPTSSTSSSRYMPKSSSSSCHHASSTKPLSMTWQALQRMMETCNPLDCR